MSGAAPPRVLPDGLLVSFYGDDFTGSTAVMEVLTFAGLPTVLFLGVPTGAARGDEFTTSSAVMEVLSFAGLPTVLFLGVPTGEQLARFKGYRGIGIAGVARSQSTDWMEINLPPGFQSLAGLAR